MKYFLDCEFMEDGKTIDLLSLALVCEDGREFYAVNCQSDHSKACEFVRDAVIPHLYDEPMMLPSTTREVIHAPQQIIKYRVQEFVRMPRADDPDYAKLKPEFWGYYSAYDWVAFCQLFGPMVALPKGYPMFCCDIIQECKRLGNPELPPQGKGEHHALLDARWNKVAYEFLVQLEAVRKSPAKSCGWSG